MEWFGPVNNWLIVPSFPYTWRGPRSQTAPYTTSLHGSLYSSQTHLALHSQMYPVSPSHSLAHILRSIYITIPNTHYKFSQLSLNFKVISQHSLQTPKYCRVDNKIIYKKQLLWLKLHLQAIFFQHIGGGTLNWQMLKLYKNRPRINSHSFTSLAPTISHIPVLIIRNSKPNPKPGKRWLYSSIIGNLGRNWFETLKRACKDLGGCRPDWWPYGQTW